MPARLILYKDNQKLGMELKDGVYRVGRDKPADIAIPDGTISGNHAELQIKASTCLVRDLGSTNGTFVNGKQISSATPVRESDELRFGSVVVKIQFPQEIKPLSDVPAGPSAATVKMEAVKEAAGRLPWTAKYWLAGMYTILFLVILFLFVLVYTDNAHERARLAARYDGLASQYVHLLGPEAPGSIPAPAVGDAFDEPLMVADKDGKILFPLPPEGAPPVKSPLINAKTSSVYETAKYGLFTIPGSAEEGKPDARSYPVRAGGNLLGFVVARPAADKGSPLLTAAVMVVLAAVVALMVLFFTLRPVHAMVRGQLENLRNKLSPLVNGFVDSLPRSRTLPEANALAEEMEKSIAQVRSEAAGGSSASGGKKVEYLELLPPLVESAQVAYCFVSSDFKLLSNNRQLARIGEFAGAGVGSSIFDTGMSAIQAKQLVQAIGDARTSGHAEVQIDLTHDGRIAPHAVGIRTFQDPSTRSQIYGIVFNRVA
jgi:hypothetical protein